MYHTGCCLAVWLPACDSQWLQPLEAMAGGPPAAGGGGSGIQQIFERNQEATIYVGNLDPKIDEEVLWELMVQCGPVANLHLPRDKITTTHQGFLNIQRVNLHVQHGLLCAAAMSGAYMRGYFPRGQRAHVVQVGLGDNRTFLHDMAAIDRRATDKGVGWLLSACTDGDICGVAVEPVWEHFEAADKLAASRLPNVKLVQAALGEYCGKTPIYRVEEPSNSELARNGLCNARAGYDSESHIVTEFEKLGYILVGRGRDTYLALQSAATSTSMQNWLGSWRCAECRREHRYPYTLTPDVLYGFVEFKNEEDADYAIKIMNMIRLFGKPIRCNKSSQDKKTNEVGANLFIGNLEPEVDEKMLYDTFSAFGVLLFAKVMRDPDNGVSRGFGFISYDTFEASDAALAGMNGQFLCNRPISVSYAYKKETKGERHGSAAERLIAANRPIKDTPGPGGPTGPGAGAPPVRPPMMPPNMPPPPGMG
eukprot:s382_g31.t2